MLKCHKQGLKLAKWAPILAKKFEISEEAIRRDWSRRHSWIHNFINLDDAFSGVKKLIAQNQLLVQDACILFEEADDPKNKLQYMWLRLKIWREQFNMMKDMGFFGPIRTNFEHKTLLHKMKLDEQRIPYLEAQRDRDIRKNALSKEHEDLAYLG